MSDDDRQQAEDEFDRRIWRMVVIGGIIVAAIVMAFGWRFVSPRLNSAKALDHMVAVVNQDDSVLAELDSAVKAAASSPSTATATALVGLKPRLADTREQLGVAKTALDAGVRRLNEDEQRAAVLVEAGAEARIAEIDAAQAISAAASTAAGNPSAENIVALKALATGSTSAYQQARAKAADADAALKAL